jgi:integrase
VTKTNNLMAECRDFKREEATMAQHGFVFRKGRSWFLRYREDVLVNGQKVRKQKCVKLADYGDRYRCPSDLDDLVSEKMSHVREAAKCPHSSDLFVSYVEETYLPFVQRTMKPSTYAGYRTYWERYLAPRVGKYAVRDFTPAIVSSLLEDIANTYTLNTDTVGKIRSILSGIFTYAIGRGHFPARSKIDNPASRALIPESATEPKRTAAATREEVQAILTALKGMPLERAAVAIVAFTGVRPGEARGLRWEEWDRMKQHIAVTRGVWHKIVGTMKTEQSERFVTVAEELREILIDLWNARGAPTSGYILAGGKGQPVILDNMAKRSIRPALKNAGIIWRGWYSMRRFLGTQVRMHADSEISAKALGNSRAVADRHYIKPQTVLPDVRKAVNDALSGLVH